MMNGMMPPGASGEAEDWTEHVHSDGRRYYYNRRTKASSWDKPDALKSGEELKNTTNWKEYKTADGRDYFFNPITKQSVWVMPKELKRLRGLPTESDEEEDSKKSGSDEEDEKEIEYNSHQERKDAFWALLKDKKVTEKMKWGDAMKLIQQDKRFNAFQTGGERKQAFNEWVAAAGKRKKDEEREQKLKSRDNWVELVKEWKSLKPSTRYRDVAEAFFQEEAFKALEEEERDELFQDFMDDYLKRLREDQRKKKKEHIDTAKKLFDATEEITTTSRWRDVSDLLQDHELFTKQLLIKVDALQAWEEWVEENMQKEKEEKRKIKFRAERLIRDAFRNTLEDYHKKGEVTAETKWGECANLVHEEESYKNLIGKPGATPHDLFDDYIIQLNDQTKQEIKKIAKLAKAHDLQITQNSTFEWFSEQLRSEDVWRKTTEQVRQQAFEMLVSKSKDQEAAAILDAEKHAKKSRKAFVELLQKTRDIKASTTYDMAENLLGDNPSWIAVNERTRRQCFDIFAGQLKIQSQSTKSSGHEVISDDEDDGGRKKKKRSRREEEPPEEPPPKKSRRHREEEEEEEPPSKKHRKRDEDELEEEPRKKKRRHRDD